MHIKKYILFLSIVGLVSLSGMTYAQTEQASFVRLANIGSQELTATYEILGGRPESGEAHLKPQQNLSVPLHADQKSLQVTSINGYATSKGGDQAKHACTSLANGNPIKLQFDSSAKQIRISCRSDEA